MDTNFRQTADSVLKIIQDDARSFFVRLHNDGMRFRIDQYDAIAKVEKQKEDLSKEYGVTCILRKTRPSSVSKANDQVCHLSTMGLVSTATGSYCIV